MIRNVFLHSTKIQLELLEEYYLCLVMVMDTVQMVSYVLADNEEDKEGSCSRGRAQVF